MVETLTLFVENNIQYLIWIIAFIAMVESLAVVGIIVPGIGLLASLSILAGHAQVNVYAMLGLAVIGAILGDGISFIIGRVFRNKLHFMWPFTKYPHWIDNGEAFFNKHGGKSIFIGRFIGPVRPFIPMVAGMLNMDSKRFLLLNVLSALCWAPVYLLPGYLFGKWIPLSSLFSWEAIAILTVASLIAIAVTWQMRHKRTQP